MTSVHPKPVEERRHGSHSDDKKGSDEETARVRWGRLGSLPHAAALCANNGGPCRSYSFRFLRRVAS